MKVNALAVLAFAFGALDHQLTARQLLADGAAARNRRRVPSLRHALDPPAQLLRRGEQLAAFAQQLLAGCRQSRAIAAPTEKQYIEVIFQSARRIGDGGRRASQFLRRAGEAAAAGDRIDEQQRFERQEGRGHIIQET